MDFKTIFVHDFTLTPVRFRGEIYQLVKTIRNTSKGKPRTQWLYEIRQNKLIGTGGYIVELKEKQEEWRDIEPVEFDGILYLADMFGQPKYECSNYFGKIRYKRTKEMVNLTDDGSYLTLKDNGKSFTVHRLIYRAFVADTIWDDDYLFNQEYCIDHIDGIKLNNQPKNLRAVDRADNSKNRHDKNIVEQFSFIPPSETKDPSRMHKWNQKLIVVEKYIIPSKKELGGLLNGDNTKPYNLSPNGKIYGMFEYELVGGKEKDDVMEQLKGFYVPRSIKYAVIDGKCYKCKEETVY